MRLIIGGASQGKRAYALKTYHLLEEDVAEDFVPAREKPLFDHFHLAVREALRTGEDPAQLTRALLSHNPNLVILCDEVGCGVVPLQPEERYWRECVGRICCELARQAESVERIFCGIPMRLR